MASANGEELMKKQPTPAFLEKLFDILEDNRSYSHLIAWQPDGNSFIIKKVNEFSEIVLPRYFKHSNIQSYIRQLNMYGFSKTRHDSNHHEFTHKLFQRGRRDLLPLIRRKTQQNGGKSSSSSDAVPLKPQKKALAGATTPTSTAPPGIALNSSEASQSSNGGIEEDMPEFFETPLVMQSRITALEEQVAALTKLCSDLLEQHNLLCEALNRQSIPSNLANMMEIDANKKRTRGISELTVDDRAPTESSPSPQTSSSSAVSSNGDEEGGPTKRMKIQNSEKCGSRLVRLTSSEPLVGEDHGVIVKTENANGSHQQGKEKRAGMELFAITTATGSDEDNAGTDFCDFKVKKSPLPPFISDVYRVAIISNGSVASSSSSGQETMSLIASSSARGRSLVDLGALIGGSDDFNLAGLEAITAAAHMLDGHGSTSEEIVARLKFPLFAASTAASNHALTSFYHKSPPVTQEDGAEEDSGDLQQQPSVTAKPGGALTKAYSIG